MFSRTLATSARSMANMTMPVASSGSSMSRYFSASASVAASKIFIGGLSWNVGESELRTHFERFGSISDVHLPTKPDGASRGFAFVEFSDDQPDGKTSEAVMKEAINECDNTEIDGRSVSVKEADAPRPREARGGGSVYNRAGGNASYGRGGRGGRGGSRGGYGGGGRDRDSYGGGGRDNYGSNF